MGRIFTIVDHETGAVMCTVSAMDDSMMLTSVMRKRADTLVGSTKAVLVTGSGNGEVAYTAKYGGEVGNSCRITHTEGATGPGNESRPLGLAVNGLEVTITFGTDSGGNPITPTATQVADLVNNDAAASQVVTAVAGGTGGFQVAEFGSTPLTGGLDDGSYLKFEGKPPVCCRIALVEVV